jgi:hypothetical protein
LELVVQLPKPNAAASLVEYRTALAADDVFDENLKVGHFQEPKKERQLCIEKQLECVWWRCACWRRDLFLPRVATKPKSKE